MADGTWGGPRPPQLATSTGSSPADGPIADREERPHGSREGAMRRVLLERPVAAMVGAALLVLSCRSPASEPGPPMTREPEAPPCASGDAVRGQQGRGSEAPPQPPSMPLALSDVPGGVRIDRGGATPFGSDLVQPGDVVVAVDDRPMRRVEELRRYVA